MNLTNHLGPEMLGILEDPQTSICIKLKGDISLTMMFRKLINLTMKIMGFNFVNQCWKHFFPNGGKVGVPTVCFIVIFVQLLRDCWW